jgi:hypothetical protein
MVKLVHDAVVTPIHLKDQSNLRLMTDGPCSTLSASSWLVATAEEGRLNIVLPDVIDVVV